MNDWRGVSEFVHVVEHGSFTRAANALGLSKSYVSKSISELETRLGVQLLFRSTRRLSLTGAGERFFAHCSEMCRIYDIAERELGAFQERPTGRLRIGLCDIFGVSYMSAVVAEYSELYPDVTVEVVAYLREDELRRQDFDIVIRYGDLPDSEMKIRRIGYLSYCLCATQSYVDTHGWPRDMNALGGHECLVDPSGEFLFNSTDGRPLRARVSGRWTSNSAIALASAARRGLGIAQVPVGIIIDSLNAGDLVALEEDWSYFDREVWACFAPGIMAAATRAFLDHVALRFDNVRLRPFMRQKVDILRNRERTSRP